MDAGERVVVGQVIGEAFADIYGPVLDHDAVLIAAVAAVFPSDVSCYVGEGAGGVRGTGFLALSGLQTGWGLVEEQTIWRLLRERQSVARALRSRLLLALPSAPNRADRTTGYISSLAVRPAWQGQGLGTALLRSLEDAAGRTGKARVGLYVADTNTRARQLYERHGFHVARVERAHFTRPIWGFRAMVYMTKPLTGPAN